MEHARMQYNFVVFAIVYAAVVTAASCPARCKTGVICNGTDRGCSECREGWFGRQCEHALECYIGRGTNYNGAANITENGIACQQWSSQTPVRHTWQSLSSEMNYCRNPNPYPGDLKPWCYQTEGYRFGLCVIPNCDTQCPVPTLYQYGDIIDPPSTGFAVGVNVSVITGGCGPGKRGSMTCGNDKTWSTWGCTTISNWCEKPSYPAPVKIEETVTGVYYQTKIHYNCITGYEVDQTGEIKCMEDKTWGPNPYCKRVECDSPKLNDNSKISHVKPKPYRYEHEITIICSTGYDIIGQTSFKCEANKQWNGTMPTCKAVECEINLKDNSYIVDRKSKYEYQSSIIIKCNDGYTIYGKTSFQCKADKSWSGEFPSCYPVLCPQPTLPRNTLVKSEEAHYVYKDKIALTCVKGSELKDQDTITCQADRTWGTIPECIVVKCEDPVLEEFIILEGNKTEYEYLDEIVLGCVREYEFKGTNTTTCLHTGEWAPIEAECLGHPAIYVGNYV